jgi:c(7)-type cytochrome triheme protein
MLPVKADLHQLNGATFSHKPHLAQTKCETCHTTAATSASGDDAMMPKVATCQSCHTPSQARANCAECHRYHAQAITAIGASAMARR